MIKPTPGRVVWYRPNAHDLPCAGQPLAAMIVYVHSDTMVNLVVYDMNGFPHSRTSVYLKQDPLSDQNGSYCEWMPYQIGQAKAAA